MGVYACVYMSACAVRGRLTYQHDGINARKSRLTKEGSPLVVVFVVGGGEGVIHHAFNCDRLLISCCSMGYKPFLRTIKGQITVLAKLVEETPPSLKLEVGTPSSGPPSVEEGNLSPTIQSIHSDSDSGAADADQTKEEKSSDCVVS